MSDPRYPGTPAPTTRPTVVTVSSWLLYLTAALTIISGVLSLTTVSTIRDVYAELYADTANSGLEGVIVAISVVTVVINLLVAAGLVILAILNNRGKQPARIVTWVVAGLFLCCSGFGLLGGAAAGSMNLDTGDTSGPSASEVEAQLSDALPSWFQPISTTLTVLTLLALLGAVILLALPAANAYFRKPQVAWDPLNPYPGYPGQQAPYPTHPGQQSPYPSYPGQPAAWQPTPPPGPATPPPGGADPHTGSMPPTDPWHPPTDPDDQQGRPPTAG